MKFNFHWMNRLFILGYNFNHIVWLGQVTQHNVMFDLHYVWIVWIVFEFLIMFESQF